MDYGKLFSDVKQVYDHLEDDISKKIWVNRILYNLTNDNKYEKKIVLENEAVKKLKEWLEKRPGEKKVIFGAGKNGRRIKEFFSEEQWEYFVDNYVEETEVDELGVISLEELLKKGNKFCFVVSPKKGSDKIMEQLKTHNVDMDDVFNFESFCSEEYFEAFLPHAKEEVFVDAGVYDAMTTRAFVKWSQDDYKKIYMFEPSLDYYDRYYHNVKMLDRCSWIKKGLWSEETVLKFFQRPDSDIATNAELDGISYKYTYSSGEEVEIPVTTLDEAIKGNVTLIKMDIEGSEYNALLGARKIISEQHPKLAICIYHKQEDIFTLPQLILSMYPEYRFYIRHYSWDMLDTVLYAIP